MKTIEAGVKKINGVSYTFKKEKNHFGVKKHIFSINDVDYTIYTLNEKGQLDFLLPHALQIDVEKLASFVTECGMKEIALSAEQTKKLIEEIGIFLYGLYQSKITGQFATCRLLVSLQHAVIGKLDTIYYRSNDKLAAWHLEEVFETEQEALQMKQAYNASLTK